MCICYFLIFYFLNDYSRGSGEEGDNGNGGCR